MIRDDASLVVIRHCRDIDFTIIADLANDYLVEFKVAEIVGYDDNDLPLWHRAGATYHPDPVDNLDDAAVYLHGHVKWDGCSNWYFDAQDECMLHGCTRRHLVNIGELLPRCWDMAAELCPKWLSSDDGGDE